MSGQSLVAEAKAMPAAQISHYALANDRVFRDTVVSTKRRQRYCLKNRHSCMFVRHIYMILLS
jgi:hypothetical protein